MSETAKQIPRSRQCSHCGGAGRMPAGQWLREERTRRGLSEHTLAEFVEAPVALVRAHEHDDPPMSWDRAYEYQLAFQRYDEYDGTGTEGAAS